MPAASAMASGQGCPQVRPCGGGTLDGRSISVLSLLFREWDYGAASRTCIVAPSPGGSYGGMPNRAAQRQALLNCTLFTAMRPEELDRLLTVASERAVRRGQTIFLKGDPGTSMMAVLKGS